MAELWANLRKTNEDVRHMSAVFNALDDLVKHWAALSDTAKEYAVEMVKLRSEQGAPCTCGHRRDDHSLGALSCDFTTCTCPNYTEETD